MAKEATLQVRMDADLKEQAELLYQSMGTTLAEAVRIFARQSVAEKALPFVVHIPDSKKETVLTDDKKSAFSKLMKYHKTLPPDFDYKAELIKAKDEKYADID